VNPEPRVTVVLITRNRRPELVRTLERMTALPERPPVIVVDNASDDGSAQAASAFPGVTVIEAPANLGAVGRNVAVREVRSPYVAFCDDDTWWEPGALARSWSSRAARKTRSLPSCATPPYPARRGCPDPPCSASWPAPRCCG
jgi:glycosyltransferase involved in cell wall biosynthesis